MPAWPNSGKVYVADDTKCDGETVFGRHHGQLQLQGVVLAVGIMNQHIVERSSLLTLHLLSVAAFVVTATTGSAGVNHEGRGLAGHCEVTGVDTITLGELDR